MWKKRNQDSARTSEYSHSIKCRSHYLSLTTRFSAQNREKLAQAYDFALEKIGMDLHAFSIWNDYVQFLRGVEATGSFAENQKITAVRKVYQKAVVTPIIGIEILWKEYIQFEQNINPIISEKMSLERSRDYMNARRVAKELEFVTKGLNRNLPAIPPTLTKEETKQVRTHFGAHFYGHSQINIGFRFSLLLHLHGHRSNCGKSTLHLKNQIRCAVRTLHL